MARAKDIIDSVAVDRAVHSLKDALGFCLQSGDGGAGARQAIAVPPSLATARLIARRAELPVA